MRTSWVTSILVCACLLTAAPAPTDTLKGFDHTEGYQDWNTLSAPVLDGSKVASVSVAEFGEAFDRSGLVFIPTYGRMKRGGHKTKLGPEVKPGGIFTDLLSTEAVKMGLRIGDGGWTLRGTIKHLVVNNHTPSAWSMGVLLYYGFMEVDIEITSPHGQEERETVQLHSYRVGGTSRKEALGFQLIEGAHSLLARLNRSHFQAPPHAGVVDLVKKVADAGVDRQESAVYAIGLSGSAEAVPVFLSLLGSEADENHRSDVINALANLGSPEAVAILTERYADEEVDPRWHTLKAFSYIRSAEALAAVERGADDEEDYNRDLAALILGQPTERYGPVEQRAGGP